MATLSDVKKKIEEYKINYRKHDLPSFEVSGIYALFPELEKNDDFEIKIDKKWPDTWPNLNRQGVYLIFGENLKLLYIGKVSMTNTFGGRLTSYFSYDKDRSCKVNHTTWSEKPIYLVNIAVPPDMSFEAPALEEFLLKEMKDSLPDNKIK